MNASGTFPRKPVENSYKQKDSCAMTMLRVQDLSVGVGRGAPFRSSAAFLNLETALQGADKFSKT